MRAALDPARVAEQRAREADGGAALPHSRRAVEEVRVRRPLGEGGVEQALGPRPAQESPGSLSRTSFAISLGRLRAVERDDPRAEDQAAARGSHVDERRNSLPLALDPIARLAAHAGSPPRDRRAAETSHRAGCRGWRRCSARARDRRRGRGRSPGRRATSRGSGRKRRRRCARARAAITSATSSARAAAKSAASAHGEICVPPRTSSRTFSPSVGAARLARHDHVAPFRLEVCPRAGRPGSTCRSRPGPRR